MSLLLSACEVARVLGVSRSWVYAHRDQLPAPVRVGGNVRWRTRDIEQWVANLPTHELAQSAPKHHPVNRPRLGVVAA